MASLTISPADYAAVQRTLSLSMASPTVSMHIHPYIHTYTACTYKWCQARLLQLLRVVQSDSACNFHQWNLSIGKRIKTAVTVHQRPHRQ